MATIIKTIKVDWTWGEAQGGDLSSIKGFKIALAPQNAGPNTGAVQLGISGPTDRSYTFNNISLSDQIYTAWVQAIYIGKDSDWISSGDITVIDNGIGTISNADLTVDDIKMGASWSTLPEDGADVTGNHTANDTTNVNGTPAETVKNNAAGAMTAVTNQSSDGVFSVQEKAAWRVQYPAIYQNYLNIINQASLYGLSTDSVITDFNAAATNLNNYLYITQDIFAATPIDTPITNNDLADYTKAFYDKMQLAVNKLADYAHTAHGISENADVTDNSDFVNITYPADKASLQNQIDGKVESWFQSTDPSSSWSGANSEHNGDMWWNTSTNKLKRYDGSSWSADLTDQTAIQAYSTAVNAQSTADGKMVVFTTQPYNYGVGDLWDAGGTPRVLKRAIVANTSYSASDWIIIANEVTDTDQISDNAGLGLNAHWSYIYNDGGKPADNADVTQVALNLGAAIDNAKANGTTLMDGGYLRNSLIQTDALIVGGIKNQGDLATQNRSNLNYQDGADKTSLNTANNASNYTGNIISTNYTSAKCTDPNADQTSLHTANNTNNVYTIPASHVSGWASSNNTTYIDGGRIYAQSITANQMAANSITADNGAIGNLAVDTLQINDEAVSTAKIGTDAVTSVGEVQSNSIYFSTHGYKVFISWSCSVYLYNHTGILSGNAQLVNANYNSVLQNIPYGSYLSSTSDSIMLNMASTFVHTPAPVVQHYTLRLDTSTNGTMYNPTIFVMEIKK